MSTEAPEILLSHYLKALKLPSFQREYQKLARLCATEGVDHVGYLTRLAEREMIERDRRKVERRIKARKVPGRQKSGQLRLHCHSEAQQDAGAASSLVANGSSAARMSLRLGPAARARPM